MKIIANCSPEEMVSVFLQAESNSPRWSKTIYQYQDLLNIDKSVITNPDLSKKAENESRAKILGLHRGYGQKNGLFDDLEKIITWKKVILDNSDFKKIKYIDYDYWNLLSSNTRLVKKAVSNIKKGIKIFDQSNDQFWQLSEKIKQGYQFPTIILKSPLPGQLVLLEGHVRLTSYLLAFQKPKPIEVIIGFYKIFTVYILRTCKNTLYTGYTNNLDKRIQKHQSGRGAKYVRSFESFQLVHTEFFPTKSEAMSREAEIKKMTHSQKESIIAHGPKR